MSLPFLLNYGLGTSCFSSGMNLPMMMGITILIIPIDDFQAESGRKFISIKYPPQMKKITFKKNLSKAQE